MMKKFYKKLSAAAMVIVLTCSLSATAFADTFTIPPVMSISPVAVQENAWGLYPDSSYIISGSIGSQVLPSAQSLTEIKVIHPGEYLIIPIVKGSYINGTFSVSDPTKLEYFTAGGNPSNWDVNKSVINASIIEDVRWYQGSESGTAGTLFLMLKFSSNFVSTQSLPINASFAIQDTAANTFSNYVNLNAQFENPCTNINTTGMNTVTSPITMKLPDGYSGTPVSFSFGEGIFLKDAVPLGGSDLYFGLDQTYDNFFANQYMQFDLKFYNFLGNFDSFQTPGKLYLPTGRQDVYVYEIINGVPSLIQAEYDEEKGQVSFLTNSLGYYVVSNTELNIK